MRNTIIAGALALVMTAGSASAGLSSVSVGGHTVGSLWNKVSVSNSMATVGVGVAALLAFNYFVTKNYNN